MLLRPFFFFTSMLDVKTACTPRFKKDKKLHDAFLCYRPGLPELPVKHFGPIKIRHRTLFFSEGNNGGRLSQSHSPAACLLLKHRWISGNHLVHGAGVWCQPMWRTSRVTILPRPVLQPHILLRLVNGLSPRSRPLRRLLVCVN